MEPTLRLTQVLKEEAEDIGLQGKDIAKYVTRQQTLDREERVAWREAHKRQVEIRMAELQAEDKKRADEIHMAERADEIKIQIAQIQAVKEQAKIETAKEQARIEADKELKIKEMELQAPKLPSLIDERDELGSYLLHFESYAENASWEKDTTDRESHGRLHQDVRYRCQ